jgi:hypothetical protein
MKNDVFRNMTPCGSCKNQRLEERIASITRVTIIGELVTTLTITSNNKQTLRLLVTANVVPRSPTLVTLMMVRSSETSELTRATRCHISDDGIPYEAPD